MENMAFATTQTPYVEAMIGPHKDGPKRCISCGQRFLLGEHWAKQWDPEHTYVIGVHDRCQQVISAFSRPPEL